MASKELGAALPPAEMANYAEATGISKAARPLLNEIALGILAGAFIALGAIVATSITAGAKDALPFGIIKLLMGLGFSVGLILVVVGGGELFTGNTLISIAWASGKVSLKKLLGNWCIVYLSNFIGALATAWLIFVAKQYTFGHGAVGKNILEIAEAKSSLGFGQAIALGMLCNAMVCMAVWLCYSGRSTSDKILAILLPITGFVAAGFEHSVANMYFIPVALLIKNGDPSFLSEIGQSASTYPQLTWDNFFTANLLPVTIGNIIGGALMVGLMYWFIYLRPAPSDQS
jgi:formate transporter